MAYTFHPPAHTYTIYINLFYLYLIYYNIFYIQYILIYSNIFYLYCIFLINISLLTCNNLEAIPNNSLNNVLKYENNWLKIQNIS